MTRDGFLHRWARRKVEARERVLEDEGGVLQDGEAAEQTPAGNLSPPPAAVTLPQTSPATGVTSEEIETPPLTLQDVQALTRDSDFAPFVSQRASPEVKNAALKKLFADPHYNVMDGLDTYIDDYSNMESLPTATLRQMVSAKALRMFEPSATDREDRPAGELAAGEAETVRVAEAPATGADHGPVHVLEPFHPDAPTSIAEPASHPKPERSTATDADATQTHRSTSTP